MTNPQRFLNRVLVFLAIVVVVMGALYEVILGAFTHNPLLNGLILFALLVGIAFNIRRILLLKPETRWIEAFRTNQPGLSLQDPPQIIAPVATVLSGRERRGRQSLSAVSLRHLLDSISSRLDESRDIARYLTQLLIYLGLLGTFWGLLQTMASIAAVIGGLSLSGTDLVGIFDELKAGLAAPLQGMGTAFSASLFGLAGSLVLGFLDLQASQAQNAFYNDLEEWLSGLTKLGGLEGAQLGEPSAAPAMPTYIQAMLQQTGENLERLERTVSRGEEGRGKLESTLAALVDQLGTLGDRLGQEQALLQRVSDSQEAIAERLSRRVEGAAAGGLDEGTRGHIRNTDIQIGRLVEEIGRGREEMTRELRGEIKLVARTIALAAGDTHTIRE